MSTFLKIALNLCHLNLYIFFFFYPGCDTGDYRSLDSGRGVCSQCTLGETRTKILPLRSRIGSARDYKSSSSVVPAAAAYVSSRI